MDVTFHNVYDELELPEHEVQEPEDAYKKGKPCLILFKTRSVKTHFTMLVSVSQDTTCQDTFPEVCFCLTRHDLSRHISRSLFLSHKTRPVKTHFPKFVSVSHPTSTSPVIEYVAPASAVTYTELSPVTEYVAPAPANTFAARSPAIEHVAPASTVTYTALSSVSEYVASAPVVFYAVIEHSALQRSGHEHEHTWKRRKKKIR